MDIYLTADTHFDHKNIIDYENRPFTDNLQMTEVLIDNWNKTVKPNDLVFHLGDVFFCKADRMKEIADRLNGRKILIRGNHDKGVSNGKFRKLGFEPFNYYQLDGLFLSHYPQSLPAMQTAMGQGAIRGNVHGHVHSQIEGLDQEIYKCVSVELTNYAPISLELVKHHFKFGGK